MTSLFQKILRIKLALLARMVLKRHKPFIIGVTGNVGKTSTRDAIYTVLSKNASVWRGKEGKNYNNEIGVPLVVLNASDQGRSVLGWIGVFIKSFLLVLGSSYPKYLVAEMGVDHPGDMEYLTSIIKPDIAVITGVGEIPVHVEFFASPEALLMEKAKILEAIKKDGHVVFNADDPVVKDLSVPEGIKKHLYGFAGDAEVRASDEVIHYGNDGGSRFPSGLFFKVNHKGSTIPVRLSGSINPAQILAALAAFTVGSIVGLKPLEIASSLSSYIPPPGRMRLIDGIKGSLILDDSYNAAPASTEAALDVLKRLEGKRKIAVLADMKELGTYTEEAHRRIGRLVSQVASYIFIVGEASTFIDEEAIKQGFDPARIFHFDNSSQVEKTLQPLIEPGDIILIKGSQSMRMERAVEDVMRHPEKAHELLTRQSVDWLVRK